jgi:hypothetical protein
LILIYVAASREAGFPIWGTPKGTSLKFINSALGGTPMEEIRDIPHIQVRANERHAFQGSQPFIVCIICRIVRKVLGSASNQYKDLYAF